MNQEPSPSAPLEISTEAQAPEISPESISPESISLDPTASPFLDSPANTDNIDFPSTNTDHNDHKIEGTPVGIQRLKPFADQKKLLWGSAAAIALALFGGAVVLAPHGFNGFEPDQARWTKIFETERNQDSKVLPLALLPAAQRTDGLKAIAASNTPSLDRSRAKYLLAVDLLKKYEGGPAVRMLEGLERDYPLLAPYILLKRGRGYELSNEPLKAQQEWQKILANYADSPVVPEALYRLGAFDPKYWDQAMAQYPEYPATQNILRKKLAKKPNQLDLMRQLVKYDPTDPGSQGIRDQLVKDFAPQLQPADWEAIADGYWLRGDYKQANSAYTKAPASPQNFYRIARSLQKQPPVGDSQKRAAQAAYKNLIQTYPKTPEAAEALNNLVGLVPPVQALAYFEQLIANFPEEAPDALFAKGKLLTQLGRSQEASQVYKTLLKKYAKTNAAAQYRWQMAEKYQDQNDLLKAWQWAQPITTHNPDSPLAPKATFWVGKWADQLGRAKDAKAAFAHLFAHYPQSYYAWRAAVLLGWNVGDFNNLRFQSPDIIVPKARPIPPAGSALFQELYQLGQDTEAIALFRSETAKVKDLDVNQQFTQALLHLAQGENLKGINQVWNLKKQVEPENKRQWQALRNNSSYWQALFPIPYDDLIVKWSRDRQLNPLLVTSLIRQESRFEPKIQSPVGATGLMQVMPATAKFVAGQIDLPQYSLTSPNDSINLGTWYLDHTHREYNNNSLLAIASYNAGPGAVSKWRQQYQTTDPDLFVQKIPYPETQGYVETVFGNYWNYLRIYNPEFAQKLAKYTGNPSLVTAPNP